MKCGRCGETLKSVADLAPHRKTPSCAASDPWGHVVELRSKGKDDTANRVVKRLLGVQGPPMSDEAKEKLRRHAEEHKEEIAQRRRARRALEKAISRPRTRKD